MRYFYSTTLIDGITHGGPIRHFPSADDVRFQVILPRVFRITFARFFLTSPHVFRLFVSTFFVRQNFTTMTLAANLAMLESMTASYVALNPFESLIEIIINREYIIIQVYECSLYIQERYSAKINIHSRVRAKNILLYSLIFYITQETISIKEDIFSLREIIFIKCITRTTFYTLIIYKILICLYNI